MSANLTKRNDNVPPAQQSNRWARWLVLSLFVVLVGAASAWGWRWFDATRVEAQAVQALIEQAEDGLRDDRLGRADDALTLLEERLDARPDASLKATVASLHRDRAAVRTFDEIFARRWAIMGDTRDVTFARKAYAQAFADYGIDLAGLSADDAAVAIEKSRIGPRLLTALDAWLDTEPKNAAILNVLRKADAEDERSTMRAAIALGNKSRLVQKAEVQQGQTLASATAFLFGVSRLVPDDQAIAILKSALVEHPESDVLTIVLASRLLDQGKAEEAAGHFGAVLTRQPNHLPALAGLSTALRRADRFDDALPLLHRCVEIDPRSSWPRTQLGVALTEVGQHDEAIGFLRQAIELDANDAAAHAFLGRNLQAKGSTEEAIDFLVKAIELDPEYAKPQAYLGLILYKHGKKAEATALLQKAIRLGAKDHRAHVTLGTLLAEAGRLDDAIPILLAAVALNPKDAASLSNVGVALHEKGRHAEAIPHLARALELDPKNVADHFNLGDALARSGKLPEAIALLRKAAAMEPQRAGVHVDVGVFLLRYKQRDEALGQFRNAHELLQADLARWTKELGNSPDAANRGKLAQAVQVLQKDAGLAVIRDEKLLTQLLPEDQAAWRQFWVNVQNLHDKAAKSAP